MCKVIIHIEDIYYEYITNQCQAWRIIEAGGRGALLRSWSEHDFGHQHVFPPGRREQAIPFRVCKYLKPNATTIAAMREAEQLAHDPNAKSYTNVEDLLKDLKS